VVSNLKDSISFEDLENVLRSVKQKYLHYIIPVDNDLSPVQFFLLKFVHHRRICTPSEIAGKFGITLGAVTGLIDRLLKLELVFRRRSEEDRRLVLIELTPKGREIINSFERERQQKFSLITSRLGKQNIKDLTDLLQKLALVLEELANNSEQKKR